MGRGSGETGVGGSKKTKMDKWIKSNDNVNIEFHVIVEIDSPAHDGSNINQNNCVRSDNTGNMLTVNQRRNVANSENNNSDDNYNHNDEKNKNYNEYNSSNINSKNSNNINKKKSREHLEREKKKWKEKTGKRRGQELKDSKWIAKE